MFIFRDGKWVYWAPNIVAFCNHGNCRPVFHEHIVDLCNALWFCNKYIAVGFKLITHVSGSLTDYICNSNPGNHFTNDLWAHDLNLVKIICVPIFILII